ncbi:hypothetical protein ABK046_46000, partial [Streptomyces caeruleatus]
HVTQINDGIRVYMERIAYIVREPTRTKENKIIQFGLFLEGINTQLNELNTLLVPTLENVVTFLILTETKRILEVIITNYDEVIASYNEDMTN